MIGKKGVRGPPALPSESVSGLYHDNGLRIFQNKPKTEIKRKKKQIVKVIKDCSLSITIKCNSKSVDFLDVRLIL